MKLSIAGSVSLAPIVMQPLEQRRKPVKELKTGDILLSELLCFRAGIARIMRDDIESRKCN